MSLPLHKGFVKLRRGIGEHLPNLSAHEASFLFADGDRTALEHSAHQAGFEPKGVVRPLKRTTPEELCVT